MSRTIVIRYTCALCDTTLWSIEVQAASDEPQDVRVPTLIQCRLCASGHGPRPQPEAL